MAEKGAFVVPTMAVIFAFLEDNTVQTMPKASMEKLLKVRDGAFAGLNNMKRAGVKMGFGTDLVGDQYVRHGTEFTLRSEILSPFDILHSATAINAEILQMEGKLGVIAKGALADLLVVDGDPLLDLGLLASNGAHLSHIMLDGNFVKRPAGTNNVAF